MHEYIAYGLSIASTLALPELSPGKGPADVTIHPGDPPSGCPPGALGEGFTQAGPEDAYLYWADVGVFHLVSGKEIVYWLTPGAGEGLVRLAIIGPVLAMLLHMRGHLVLHGSTVAGASGAVALLGECGSGKSTLATALCAAGFSLLTDDVLLLEESEGLLYAHPGTPNIKIWPEAARELGFVPEEMPKLDPERDKRLLDRKGCFSGEPVPLTSIYIIEEDERTALEQLSASEAMIEAVRHSYCTRALMGPGKAAHFEQCEGLVRRVPFKRLKRVEDLSTLPDIVRMLTDDIADSSR